MAKKSFEIRLSFIEKSEGRLADLYVVSVVLPDNAQERDEALSNMTKLKRAMTAEAYKIFSGAQDDGFLADKDGQHVLLPVNGSPNQLGMYFALLDLQLNEELFTLDMQRILHRTFEAPGARLS